MFMEASVWISATDVRLTSSFDPSGLLTVSFMFSRSLLVKPDDWFSTTTSMEEPA